MRTFSRPPNCVTCSSRWFRTAMSIWIQWFGKQLYELYLAPDAPMTQAKRRRSLAVEGRPSFDSSMVNQDVLGDKARVRILRLVAEIRACPGYVLVESLGGHDYGTISRSERYGVLSCRSGRQRRRKRWSVHLNTTWAGALRPVRTLEEVELLDAGVRRHGRRLPARASAWPPHNEVEDERHTSAPRTPSSVPQGEEQALSGEGAGGRCLTRPLGGQATNQDSAAAIRGENTAVSCEQ